MKGNSKKTMSIFTVVFFLSCIVLLTLFGLGFTSQGFYRVFRFNGGVDAIPAFANIGYKDLWLSINGIKGSDLKAFFFPEFSANTSIAIYLGYAVILFTVIFIIAEIIVFCKKDKKSMIFWIIPTLIFGCLGLEMMLLAHHYIGFEPKSFFAKAGANNFKAFFTFNAKTSGTSALVTNAYGATLYGFCITAVVAFITGLGMIISPLVYACSKENATEAKPENAKEAKAAKAAKKGKKANEAINPDGEFNPDELQASEFEENVNNLNTIGTTSPLVVQYINSYGEQGGQTGSSAPLKANDDEYVKKADLKDMFAEVISAIREEKARPEECTKLVISEQKVDDVVTENKVEEEPVVLEKEPVVLEKEPCECSCECECTCEEPEVEETPKEIKLEDVYADLVDTDGNQVEVIDSEDLKTFIQNAVLETLEANQKAQEEKEAALKAEEAIVNEPKETVAYEEVEEVEEPVVKEEAPAVNQTIVVAVPADYKEEPEEVVEEEISEDDVQSLDEIREIITAEVRDIFKDIAKPAPAPTPVKKVEPKPEVKPEPKPVVEEKAPVVEVKPEPVVEKPVKTVPVRNDVRGSETVVERGEVVRLNFLEKVSSGSKDLVRNYNAIKSLLMSFGLKDRLSNSADTFRLHKNTYAKITTNGDSMKLFLALDPQDFMSTALPIQDMSHKAAYKEIPLAIKVKSEVSLRRATELVYACMRKAGFEQIEGFDMDVDYVKLVRKELKMQENSKK